MAASRISQQIKQFNTHIHAYTTCCHTFSCFPCFAFTATAELPHAQRLSSHILYLLLRHSNSHYLVRVDFTIFYRFLLLRYLWRYFISRSLHALYPPLKPAHCVFVGKYFVECFADRAAPCMLGFRLSNTNFISFDFYNFFQPPHRLRSALTAQLGVCAVVCVWNFFSGFS